MKFSGPKLTLYLALISLAIFSAACFKEEQPAHPPTLYVVAIDQSVSVSAEQKENWLAPSQKLIEGLLGGDAILILGMHDNTLSAKPIYNEALPVMPEYPTQEEDEAIRKEWQRIRLAARAKLAEALRSKIGAQWTDIFSLANRIPVEGGRRTLLLLLSDMIHSTEELDMESTRLSDKEFKEHLHQALSRRQLRKAMLAGVEVHCLLNSIESKQSQPVNDRILMKQFWGSFFTALGAELKTFETHLEID